jgi:hypothetical protein
MDRNGLAGVQPKEDAGPGSGILLSAPVTLVGAREVEKPSGTFVHNRLRSPSKREAPFYGPGGSIHQEEASGPGKKAFPLWDTKA